MRVNILRYMSLLHICEGEEAHAIKRLCLNHDAIRDVVVWLRFFQIKRQPLKVSTGHNLLTNCVNSMLTFCSFKDSLKVFFLLLRRSKGSYVAYKDVCVVNVVAVCSSGIIREILISCWLNSLSVNVSTWPLLCVSLTFGPHKGK